MNSSPNNYLDQVVPLPGASTPEARKGCDALRYLNQCGKLSVEDTDFICGSVDPFHDKPLDHLAGVPDGLLERSIVHDVVTTLVLSRPAGFVNPAGFNIRLDVQPLLMNSFMQTAFMNGPAIQTTTSLTNAMGCVNVTYDDNTNVFVNNYAAGGATTYGGAANCDNPPAQFLVNPIKIIGMGVEVVNTTNILNVSGACHIAVQPQKSINRSGAFKVETTPAVPTLTSSVSAEFYEVKSPPTTVAQLCLIPGNTSWAAKDGCFCVCRIKYDEQAESTNNCWPRYPMVNLSGDLIPTATSGNPANANVLITSTATVSPNGVNATMGFSCIPVSFPVEQTVIMFTGLNILSTFELRVRWLVQRVPSLTSSALINLAKNPPPLNPLALEIVSRALDHLPPGVTFRENKEGTWWSRFLTIFPSIASSLSSGLALIPHPIAKGAAAALAGAGTAASAWNGSKKEKKKEKKKMKKRAKKPNSSWESGGGGKGGAYGNRRIQTELMKSLISENNRLKALPAPKKALPRPKSSSK